MVVVEEVEVVEVHLKIQDWIMWLLRLLIV